MRRYLYAVPFVFLVGALLPTSAWAHNDPQPDNFAVYTGDSRFGDSVCADCHTGGLNTSKGSVSLAFNGSNSAKTYTPGASIPIQITVADTGGGRISWGFELAARFSNGNQAGSFTASNVGCPSSNTSCTHTLTGFPGASLTVMTHYNPVQTAPVTSFTFTVNWTAPASSSGGVIYFSAAGNAANGQGLATLDLSGDRIYTTEVGLTAGSSTPPPTVPSNGVVEGAGFTHTIAAGGIASIFGSNLAANTLAATVLPLPTTLGATSVTMNGIKCALFFVSAGQINFQVPWELQSSATSTLTVTAEGGTSTAITIPISSGGPGIFIISGVPNLPSQGAVQIANTTTFVAPVGSIGGSTCTPAKAGQFITIYASGLGAVSNTPGDGVAAGSGNSLSTASGTVSVTIGGVAAPFSFAGLSPGFVGLYQVNVQIPSGLGTNSSAPLVVTLMTTTNQTFTSNTATIAVQ